MDMDSIELIKLYEKVFKQIFGDLKEISDIDKSAFLALFVGRSNQLGEVLPIIRDFKDNNFQTKQNILIKGSAGVGKTTLMRRVIVEKDLFDSKLGYIFLDYNNLLNLRNKDGFLIEMLSKFDSFYKDTNYPLNGLNNIYKEDSINENYHKLLEHLHSIDNENSIKKLVLIIDDLDYSDTHWKGILDQIIRFTEFKHIMIILNARPPLINDILNTNDKFRSKFIKNVKCIEMQPIEVLNLITSRISIFLKDDIEKKGIFERVLELLPYYNSKNPLETIIKKTKICSKDELNQIKNKLDLYFTEENIQFIREITNGNIREIFYIAQIMLLYMIKNIDNLEKHIFHGYIMPKEELLKLFNDKTQEFFFIDILDNNYKVVLEYIQDKEKIDRQAYIFFKRKFKLDQEEVDDIIKELLNFKNRLICPISLNVYNEKENIHYKVTSKGLYYLNQIMYWETYCKVENNV